MCFFLHVFADLEFKGERKPPLRVTRWLNLQQELAGPFEPSQEAVRPHSP